MGQNVHFQSQSKDETSQGEMRLKPMKSPNCLMFSASPAPRHTVVEYEFPEGLDNPAQRLRSLYLLRVFSRAYSESLRLPLADSRVLGMSLFLGSHRFSDFTLMVLCSTL